MKNYILVVLIILFAATGCSEDTVGESIKGSITGKVIEKSTGEPLENVKISTSPASSTVFTDENGEFILADVLIGEYSVKAEMEDYATSFEAVTITEGSASNVAFELSTTEANNRKPNTPELVSPEDQASRLEIPVKFVWQATDPENDSLTYELELWNNRNNEILTYSDIRDTTYTIADLERGYRYFWQVKVSDSINEPVLSTVRSFTTVNAPESRIYYTRAVDGNYVIFANDTTDVDYALTSSSDYSFRPRKNNSTNKIAFLRVVEGQTHIFTMDPDGSQQRQVTSRIPVNGFNLNQLDFSWANDGATIIYPNFNKLYRVNSNGGGATSIFQTPNGDFITEVDVSEDDQKIAIITNNSNGYSSNLYIINFQGEIIEQVLNNVEGALGGLDISIRGDLLLYTHDVSGFENESYRRLDSRIFLHDLITGETTDLSLEKEEGTNDLDPRFSPNEAEVIFVNTSNDEISQRYIYRMFIDDNDEFIENRTLLIENGRMPDWE